MTKIRVIIRTDGEPTDPIAIGRAVAGAVGRQVTVPDGGKTYSVEAYVENHRAAWSPGPPEKMRVGRWSSGIVDGVGTVKNELDRLHGLLRASDAGGNWRGEVEQAIAHLDAALQQGSGIPDLIEVSAD